MCGREIKHTEERLTGPAFAPMSLGTRFIPDVHIREVVVLLVIVRAVVSSLAKIFRETPDLLRQFYFGAQVLGAERRRVNPRDQTGTGRRAHRGGRKRLGIKHRLAGQLIQVRRDRLRIAVAAQIGGADVFARNPKNIGRTFGRRNGRLSLHSGAS